MINMGVLYNLNFCSSMWVSFQSGRLVNVGVLCVVCNHTLAVAASLSICTWGGSSMWVSFVSLILNRR